MKKILLPTDFSDNSRNAIKYAVELYKDEKCLFYLLNTIYDTDNILHGSIYEIYKERSFKELELLEQEISSKYKNDKHSFKKVATVNLLNEQIKTLVKAEGIDLIIMGTQGATGAQEILFGSYTVSAIKVAECPLLAIPEEFSYRKPKNIVLATDYGVDFESYQLDLLKKVAKRNNSQLHVVHVNVNDKPLKEIEVHSKEMLKNSLKDLDVVFDEVEGNSVQEAIFKYDDTTPIDLLVMIKHKHTFFERLFLGSQIYKIGYHTTFPFLVLPSEYVEETTTV
ncbi:universal stress protein [Neptunitalea lumnitzerae]|uniref:Universal stress protein UspA n=1 Tax=Neptunitalea lumnitzerae TaxID=2965509 RepID=A0ABQ5MLK8_9FLAO|nr:universal stress protein [Neptunitalea sp. Y10]GLB50290.1 universal stress protein UspA [Neptunitalea sp. Y10]